MTPLEIIKDAYDRAGVIYVVRTFGDNGFQYLVTCSKQGKAMHEQCSEAAFLSRYFMEFSPDGRIASY